ncbi:bifunctional (p)ppGpp synthetase/guanosine-3',5'-bis(diphosphate) 3'-pyrophosphohydrolase, partial [Candidatus Woesearchaeota archaeon]|nr:bifunctional (p)ppGpp synthetase/guanosine-3',5'-bis(diphosphate) 3'-pyrophosphohydrolase [Candidatus Woesearchaeota archaeon]
MEKVSSLGSVSSLQTKESFFQLCIQKEYSKAAQEQFKTALELSQKAFSEKKRLCGDSYFDHNLRVGGILVENKADPQSIIAGFLHGTLPEKLEEEAFRVFGKEVLDLRLGVAELKTLKTRNQQLQAEVVRKIIMATIRDVRIIIIKLAHKLDNVRTLSGVAPLDQKKVAEEVLEVYAPLAYRLGMEKIRRELEDIAFAVLHPKKHQEILNFLQASQEQRDKDIQEALQKVEKIALYYPELPLLKIKGRPKHVYSIYRKMTKRGVPLDEQYDLLGIRVVVSEVKDCYALLGRLHEHFSPVEGKLKDYIAHPKANGYQSIHTTLVVPLSSGKKMVEVQMRTPGMDEYSEEGIAAHWKYKGTSSDQLFEKKVSWLKAILDLQKEEGVHEFLKTAKVDLFGDKIHCYTPKGDVKELPEGAMLLDFAYAVHEEVGNRAIGGKVNGIFVPLKHGLVIGDVVEVLTNKNQHPRRSWIKIVKSPKTRQKIRRFLKENEKLPTTFYRPPQAIVKEGEGVLAESLQYPHAFCMLAKCCLPLPGQEIIGIPTKRRIISVHLKECRHAEKEQKRWAATQWKSTFSQKIRFFVQAQERSGLLADVLNTIAQAGFKV